MPTSAISFFRPYEPSDASDLGSIRATAPTAAHPSAVDGSPADCRADTTASPAGEPGDIPAKPLLPCKARECLDLARQLIQEWAGASTEAFPATEDGNLSLDPAEQAQRREAPGVDTEPLADSLQAVEQGVQQIETVMVRLGRLCNAAPALASDPRALNMLDHVVRSHEVQLKAACRSTFTALIDFEAAFHATLEQSHPHEPVLTPDTAVAHADDTLANPRALHQMIAAVKGLVTMIMAALTTGDRLALLPPAKALDAIAHQPGNDAAASAAATPSNASVGKVERATSRLQEVKTMCEDMLAQLHDDLPSASSKDGPISVAGAGPRQPGDADTKIPSFFAFFELVDCMEKNPPRTWTRHEAWLLQRLTQNVPTEGTEWAARALTRLIRAYPEEHRSALQSYYDLAFPQPVAVPQPAVPADVDTPATSPMPNLAHEPSNERSRWTRLASAMLTWAIGKLAEA